MINFLYKFYIKCNLLYKSYIFVLTKANSITIYMPSLTRQYKYMENRVEYQ
jgi:hypothetical protein